MADSEKTLLLKMKADLDGYNRDVLVALKNTVQFQKASVNALTAVEKKTKSFQTKVTRSHNLLAKSVKDSQGAISESYQQSTDSMFKFSNVAKGVFVALGAGAFTNFADDVQKANNQLKAVTDTTEEFVTIQEKLNAIANETRQSVTELTSVYARFSRAGKEAGFTTEENLALTESLTKAFKIEGNTTAEVNSTLLQLTQSFRSGRIQGEEFRAVSESSTLVLEALAKQMNVSVGELKKLASEGQITARTLVDGLAASAEKINKEFKELEPTFAEVGSAIGNAMVRGFNDSGLPSYLNNFKRELIDAFTPDTENQLVQKIEEANAALERLNLLEVSDAFGTISQAIEQTEGRVVEMTAALEKLRQEKEAATGESSGEALAESLEQDIAAIEKRLEAERAYAETVEAIRSDGRITEEERLVALVAANKAALDQKLIDEAEFNEAQAALATEQSEGYLKSPISDEKIAQEEDFITRMAELDQLRLAEQISIQDFELESVKNLFANKLITAEQYTESVLGLAKKESAEKDKLAAGENKRKQQSLSAEKSYVSAAKSLSGAFLEDNKALNAGLIVADTAVNVVQSVKNAGGAPLGIPAGIAAAAMGVAQLAANASASKGGGSISASGGASVAPAPSDFSPETAEQTVSITESGEGTVSTGVQQVTFAADGGSASEQFLAESMNEGVRRGSITVNQGAQA